jgi:hypothetical protein
VRRARAAAQMLHKPEPVSAGEAVRRLAAVQALLPGGGMFRAVAIDDGVVVGDWDAVVGDARFARERADAERFLGA